MEYPSLVIPLLAAHQDTLFRIFLCFGLKEKGLPDAFRPSHR